MSEVPKIARRTKGLCNICMAAADADLRAESSSVILEKRCTRHGATRSFVSANGEAYVRLDKAYHTIFPGSSPPFPGVDRYLFLTNDCNQNCPYCITEANRHPYYQDFPAGALEKIVAAHAGKKISFIGGEPLLHPDIIDFAALVARHGKTLVVYTNGLRLADMAFLDALSGAAPHLEVRMTFEGFDNDDYGHLSNPEIKTTKLKALANLEERGIDTVLGTTLLANEDPGNVKKRFGRLFDYAKNHDFIRGLTVQSTVAAGGAIDLSASDCLSVDGVMDAILKTGEIPVSREQVYVAQKLIYILAHLFELPICAYVQSAMVFKVGNDWVGLDYFLDCKKLDMRLDRLIRNWKPERISVIFRAVAGILSSVKFSRIDDLLKTAFDVLPLFISSYEFSMIPHSVLPVVSITVCDRYYYDSAIARRCEKYAHTWKDGSTTDELCSDMLIRQAGERMLSSGRRRPQSQKRAVSRR